MRRLWGPALALVLPLGMLGAPGVAAATTTGSDVGGTVWLDLDGDGTRDDGEPGRAGVQVTLRTSATILDATTTDPDGRWSLGNVPPGTYGLAVEPPIDHVITGGTLPGLDPATGQATLEVRGEDVDEAGTVGLGSPVAGGPDVATTVVHDGTTSDGHHVWVVDVHNLGPASADGPLDVRVVLSPDHEAVATSGDGWACDLSVSIVLCEHAEGLAPAGSLPTLRLMSAAVGDVGASLSVTATARLDGIFDAAPLNDEDSATAAIDPALAAEDLDGDGAGELTETGLSVTGLVAAALLALLAGAATIRASRATRR